MWKRLSALLIAAVLAVSEVSLPLPAHATVGTQNSSITVQGNGATSTFNYNFLIPTQSPTPVVVSLLDTTVTPNVTSILSPSLFTITGLGNSSGGTVIYPLSGAPIVSGQYLTITRDVPLTQTISISNQGTFYPHVVEQGLDQLELQIQQLNTAVGSTQTGQTAGGDLSGAYPAPQVTNLSNVSNGSLKNSALVNQSIFIGPQTVALGGSASVQGSGPNIQLQTGGWTTGHCLAYDAAGNAVDSGSSCGGGGGGSVLPSSVNNLGYYSSTSQISGIATANNGTLVTSGSGVPSISSTLPVAVQNNISASNIVTGTLGAGRLPLATTSTFGAVKPDGTTITVSAGVISAAGGGSGCTAATNHCVGWFNVVSYGADPSGAADSTSAINSALTAASSGGIIYFPAGIYKFSSFSVTTPNTWLQGDGIGSTYLKTTVTASDAITFGNSSATSVSLNMGASNMQLAALNTQSSGYLIHVWNIQGSVFQNLQLWDQTGTAKSYNGFGLDCTIAAGCYNHAMTNVNVSSALHDGFDIGINSTSGPPSGVYMNYSNAGPQIGSTALAIGWVSGFYGFNVSTGGGSTGWGFFPTSGKWVFNVYLSNCLGDSATGDGYELSGAGVYADIHLDHSWGSTNTGNGVNVATTATGLNGLEITGGQYDNNGQFGIIVQAGKNIIVNGVQAGNNSASSSGSYDGITFSGTATQFSVANSISGVVGYPWTNSTAIQRYGINIASGSNNNYIVQGNILANNITSGLIDSGSTTKIICNNSNTSVTSNCSGGSGTVTSVTGSGNVTASPTTGNVVVGMTSTPAFTKASFSGSGGQAIGLTAAEEIYCASGCSGGYNLLFEDTGGQTWLGDSAASNIVVQNKVIPNPTNTYSLGQSANVFSAVYAQAGIFSNSATINSLTVPSITGGITNGDCVKFSGTSGLITDAGAACGGGGGAVSSVSGSGSGISVTPTTGAVVVSNTGVTSMSGGTNISVSASTGSVSVSTSANPTFTTVHANGSGSIGFTVPAATEFQCSSGCPGTGNMMFEDSSGQLWLGNTVSTGNIVMQNNIEPSSDNTYSDGKSGNRWTVVYAVTGTINTSDVRDKNVLGDESLGLDFIRALHPVEYRWKDQKEGQEGVFHGLLAQEVETTLAGRDFAGLLKPTEDKRGGLRYTEFIAPLAKGEQELAAWIDRIEDKVSFAYALIVVLGLWNVWLTIQVRRNKRR